MALLCLTLTPSDTSFPAMSLLMIFYCTLWLAGWLGTLHVLPSTLSLAPSWPICTTACFCRLRNVSCLCGQNCFRQLRNILRRLLLPATQCLVPLWPKLLLPATQYLDRFWQLLTSCAFMAKSALLAMRCHTMSRNVSRSLFSQLPYWCLARRCPVPVEPLCWQPN